MEKILGVISQMEADGVIVRYAITGCCKAALETVLERGGGGCAAVGAVAIDGDNDKPASKADVAAPPENATHAFFSSLLSAPTSRMNRKFFPTQGGRRKMLR